MMATGGYDVNRATVYDDKGLLKKSDLIGLICFMCKCILRNPRQVVTCGHRYCKQCIEQLTSGSENSYICPEDKERFLENDVHIDNACSKEIEVLRVDCPNGCTWNGMLLEMEKHIEECPNMRLLCSHGCGEQILKRDLGLHGSSLCSKRPTPCQYCRKNIPWDTMEDHIVTCEECPGDCLYCKKQLPNKKELSRHLEEECDERDMTCQKGDCQFKGKRPEMIKHIASAHLIQILGLLEKLKAENEKLQSEVAKCLEENQRLHKELLEIQSQEENDSGTRAYSADWAQQCTDIEDTAEQQQPATYRDYVKSSRSQSQPANHEMTSQLQGTSMKTSSLTSLPNYFTAIEEVSLRQDELSVKTVTTNGLFTWTIDEIRKSYQEAVDAKKPCLYSPPFYTSPHGYRVCICTYLNGDGDGKGTHISVFFFIMRSQHDDQLPWPFKHTVRFTLINQKNPAASITEAFVPDLHSPSFKKPTFNMNIPCGIPKFASHAVLKDENFTGNNTLTIHCQVDPNGLALL